jgi:hypothetical protein
LYPGFQLQHHRVQQPFERECKIYTPHHTAASSRSSARLATCDVSNEQRMPAHEAVMNHMVHF